MLQFSHPQETNKIFTSLYAGPKRSSEITNCIDSVSGPTIYSILKELEDMGFINKIEKSPRNVQYYLTEKGRKMVEEDYAQTESTLVELVRNTPQQKQILIDVIVEDLVKDLSSDWKTPKRIKIIKELVATELEKAKKDVINTIKTVNHVSEVESI